MAVPFIVSFFEAIGCSALNNLLIYNINTKILQLLATMYVHMYVCTLGWIVCICKHNLVWFMQIHKKNYSRHFKTVIGIMGF